MLDNRAWEKRDALRGMLSSRGKILVKRNSLRARGYSQQMKRIKLINMGDIRLIQLISCEVGRNVIIRPLLSYKYYVYVGARRAVPQLFLERRNNF